MPQSEQGAASPASVSVRAWREPTLEQLVIRAQQGDPPAFEELVMRHTTETYRLASAIVGANDANDVAQETFVDAWRRLRHLRQPDRFGTWLRAICINACRMHLRSRGRRPQTVAWNHDTVPDRGESDVTAAVASRDALDRAFERLAPDVRVVMALHYVSDLPIREVAAVLRVPEGTAKSRLNAGLRALRAELTPEFAA